MQCTNENKTFTYHLVKTHKISMSSLQYLRNSTAYQLSQRIKPMQIDNLIFQFHLITGCQFGIFFSPSISYQIIEFKIVTLISYRYKLESITWTGFHSAHQFYRYVYLSHEHRFGNNNLTFKIQFDSFDFAHWLCSVKML